MKNERWTEPVEVNLEACGKNTVVGPLEALALLTERWPNTRGLSFVKARSACRAALDGRKSPEEARRCFTDAVSEVQNKTH
ncbi:MULTISPECIES: DUF982 domain-containing protein [Rhizobium/Agrobacterium group]|uniref:DUF982 domain-containing protein n=1 Tax=Rhizobium/Agrobacterium group TaxID=227290 RepID=UPI00110F04D4|nr:MULTISPECIES: DUF982 domain-containing protein [Rhizobium/Agrobacterium group]NWJ24713.1 DUF982 domain-containing protein [Rhizobium sp. RM]TMV16514.1 DUF982 domain-containing protein [Rhizobium sp. Td3]UXS00057.1 DUF982 domain-containing protein [Agrobacterium tumefaciens]